MYGRILAVGLFLAGIWCVSASAQFKGGAGFGTPGFTSPAASGGGAFTPASLSGLLLWVEADTGTYTDTGCTTAATNGQNVACWKDQSTNANNLKNSTGTSTNGPTLNTNSLNSLPTLNWSWPSTQCLNTTVSQVSIGGTTASGFLLARSADVSHFGSNGRYLNYIATGDTNDTDSNSSIIFTYGPTTTSLSSFRNGSTSSGTATNNVFVQFGAVFDGTNNTLYIANSAQTAGSSSGSIGATGRVNAGCNWAAGTPNALLGGDIAAIVLTSSAMSSTDRSNLHTYWFNKWAVN